VVILAMTSHWIPEGGERVSETCCSKSSDNISKSRMALLQGGVDDVTMKSLNVGSKTSYNSQVLSAGNVLKMSNIQLDSFLFDLMKNNMKEEFVMSCCKRLFVGDHFHSKEETKVQLLCNREKNQDKKLESKSSSSPIQNLGEAHRKTNAHVTYDI
jgi:hypothetical protein